MQNKILVFLGILAAHSYVKAQVNKCTVDGNVVYQQGPCPRGSIATEVKAAPARSSSVTDSSDSDYKLRKLREDYLRAKNEADLVVEKYCKGKTIEVPVIGMNDADLNCMPKFRTAEKVNVTITALGETKQYVYRDHGRTSYVYSTNGKITSMQQER